MNTYRQAVTPAAYRKAAIATGLFFLITHVTSVGASILYGSMLDQTGSIIGSGSSTRLLLGILLEVILAMANIGTAVALYPVMKKWGEGAALGYAALRTLEGAIIAVGVIPVMALVALRTMDAAAGSDPNTLATFGSALNALHNATLLIGPGLVCGVNTVVMASLMFKSRAVPRIIPLLGLIGGPLVFIVDSGKLLGLYAQIPPILAILVLPIFTWEVSLALWLIFKGFRRTATISDPSQSAANELSIFTP